MATWATTRGMQAQKKIEIMSQARSPEQKDVRNPSLPAALAESPATRHALRACAPRPTTQAQSRPVSGSQRLRRRVLSQRPAPSPVAQLPKRGLVPAASAVASPSPRPLPARRPPAAGRCSVARLAPRPVSPRPPGARQPPGHAPSRLWPTTHHHRVSESPISQHLVGSPARPRAVRSSK
jgi:hypothetical protein